LIFDGLATATMPSVMDEDDEVGKDQEPGDDEGGGGDDEDDASVARIAKTLNQRSRGTKRKIVVADGEEERGDEDEDDDEDEDPPNDRGRAKNASRSLRLRQQRIFADDDEDDEDVEDDAGNNADCLENHREIPNNEPPRRIVLHADGDGDVGGRLVRDELDEILERDFEEPTEIPNKVWDLPTIVKYRDADGKPCWDCLHCGHRSVGGWNATKVKAHLAKIPGQDIAICGGTFR